MDGNALRGLFHGMDMTCCTFQLFQRTIPLIQLNLMFLFNAGFMMECSTWSGAESLNLQFMVPKVGTFVISLSIANSCRVTSAEIS